MRIVIMVPITLDAVSTLSAAKEAVQIVKDSGITVSDRFDPEIAGWELDDDHHWDYRSQRKRETPS